MPKYQPVLKNYVSTRIFIFPEDDMSDPRSQMRVQRTGGDTIEGFVEVTVFGELDIDASIVFTGISRIWIDSNNGPDAPQIPLTTAEHKFLTERSEGERSHARIEGPFTIHRYPFHFTVPEELVSPFGDVNPLYLRIPPTVKLGTTYHRSSDGRTFMQPLIVYHIRATLTTSADEPFSSGSTCWVQREIEMLPSSGIAPPLDVDDYPGEFQLQARANVYNHFLQRSREVIEISTEEPQPLDVLTCTPRASTKLFLNMRFEVDASTAQTDQPYEWECEVQTTVRSRTFYSTARLERNATVVEASRQKGLALRIEGVFTEVRQSALPCWKKCHILPGEIINPERSTLPWTTMVCIPVSAPKTLLPTFMTEMAARRYSIMVQVRIKGVRHGKLTLEVPVQVVQGLGGGEFSQDVHRGQEVDGLGGEMGQLSMGEAQGEAGARLPPAYCETE